MDENKTFYKVVWRDHTDRLWSAAQGAAQFRHNPFSLEYRPGEVTLPLPGTRLFVFADYHNALRYIPYIQLDHSSTSPYRIWHCLATDAMPLWRRAAHNENYQWFWRKYNENRDQMSQLPYTPTQLSGWTALVPAGTCVATAVVLLSEEPW